MNLVSKPDQSKTRSIVPLPQLYLATKFHKNPSTCFYVTVLTSRQTKVNVGVGGGNEIVN